MNSNSTLDSNKEIISFFRMKCLSAQIIDVLNYIMYKLNDSKLSYHDLSSIKIDYMQKTTKNYKLIKELDSLFGTDFSSSEFLPNNNIVPMNEVDFWKKTIASPKTSRFVFIISINSNNEYITQFQYIFLLLNYLREKNIHITIIFNPESIKYNKSGGIVNDDYFRIRIALKLTYALDFNFLYNTIWFYFTDKKECRRIYAQIPSFFESNQDIGTIFPILNISRMQYMALTKKCKLSQTKKSDENNMDIFERALLTWCGGELRKLENEVDENLTNMILKLLNKDNYLDAILFLYICYAIINSKDYSIRNSKNQGIKKYEIITNDLSLSKLIYLHEVCIDFSQGILQLLENIVLHVIGENSSKGCGTLSLRLHEENKNKYRMYIYINDLQFSGFENLVQKFVNNNPGFQYSDCLQLSNFFDGENIELEHYMEQTEQIAMHYGLQIFDSVVREHDGKLFVSSGDNSYSNQDKAVSPLIYSGTAYEIEFEINSVVPKTISYSDTVFPVKERTISDFKKEIVISFIESDFCKLQFKIESDYITIKASNKEGIITEIKDILLDNCSGYDCLIANCLNINNIINYEIIAKSLFLFINNTGTINNIAIVNLSSKLDVVKLFRQFALFFNRKGNSPFNENKKIFIIDKNGDADVLIAGKNLSDINSLSLYERIYGGIDTQMEKIINSITKRSNMEEDNE